MISPDIPKPTGVIEGKDITAWHQELDKMMSQWDEIHKMGGSTAELEASIKAAFRNVITLDIHVPPAEKEIILAVTDSPNLDFPTLRQLTVKGDTRANEPQI